MNNARQKKIKSNKNDDWNNSNDSESETVTVKKRVTKRSKLRDIDECETDSKIAQESIRKKILPNHLFAMNFTVIHSVSTTLFFVGKWCFYPISREFQTLKREFTFC